MGMTLQQAADTLGVSTSASKKEINEAYRKLIGKYHPDAHRNDSEAEQAAAEKMFKAVNKAKKIMLDPSKADEPAPPPQPQQPSHPQQPSSYQDPYQGAYQDTFHGSYTPPPPRPQSHTPQTEYKTPHPSPEYRMPDQPSGQSVDDDDYYYTIPKSGRRTSRQAYNDDFNYGDVPMTGNPNRPRTQVVYNKSTSFSDGIPQIPDPAEAQIADFFKEDATKMYWSSKDKFRLTPSFIISFVLIIAALITMMGMPHTPKTFASTMLPYIIMMVVCLVKAGLYDLLISYNVAKALREKANLGWLFACGIEMVVFSSAFTILAFVMGQTLAPALIVCIVAGIGLLIGGFVMKIQSDQYD